MREYPPSKPVRREELKGMTAVAKWTHVISGGGVFRTHKSTAKPKWPDPYALPRLPCSTGTRKSRAFCSSRFIFTLFSSNRIKIYLEKFRSGQRQRHEYSN
jgi:hypothetical protein